ncbi:MAG: Ppx/GppA family phosphatase [Nitrospirae bacterium]|nr:Ppx/GppA family phosphatase [Nitrospirota bacterium]
MILAGIDIGTNTLRLLIAETGPDSFHEIYADRKITRLGMDLDRRGALTREAEDRSLKALVDFAEKVRRHGVLHTAVIGTSALRNASNAALFIEEVKTKTDLAIRVITGEEEARLTLAGVVHALKGFEGPQSEALESAFVIDIGGGSTEIIVTHPAEETTMASLPLGAVYLTERYIKNDPPTPAETAQLRRAVKDILEQHGGMLKTGPGKSLIGTAGTITTLAAMDLGLVEYAPDTINGHTLARETVNAIVRKLTASTLKERRSIPGLETGREDIILAGAVVVQEIMERFGYMTMVVSDWGLREGIVLDLYKKICN